MVMPILSVASAAIALPPRAGRAALPSRPTLKWRLERFIARSLAAALGRRYTHEVEPESPTEVPSSRGQFAMRLLTWARGAAPPLRGDRQRPARQQNGCRFLVAGRIGLVASILTGSAAARRCW